MSGRYKSSAWKPWSSAYWHGHARGVGFGRPLAFASAVADETGAGGMDGERFIARRISWRVRDGDEHD